MVDVKKERNEGSDQDNRIDSKLIHNFQVALMELYRMQIVAEELADAHLDYTEDVKEQYKKCVAASWDIFKSCGMNTYQTAPDIRPLEGTNQEIILELLNQVYITNYLLKINGQVPIITHKSGVLAVLYAFGDERLKIDLDGILDDLDKEYEENV